MVKARLSNGRMLYMLPEARRVEVRRTTRVVDKLRVCFIGGTRVLSGRIIIARRYCTVTVCRSRINNIRMQGMYSTCTVADRRNKWR